MMLQFIAALVLGLMCGSELSVAAFAHPTLNRQPLAVHITVRSSFTAQLGRVMPFWMVGSTLLNLLLLLRFERLNTVSWRLAAIALAIQVAAVVVFSYRPCSNQQSNRKMDAGIASKRLAKSGTSLGRLPRRQNACADCGLRTSGSQCWVTLERKR